MEKHDVDIYEEICARSPGWYIARCNECDWYTTGSEPVCEDAAVEHQENQQMDPEYLARLRAAVPDYATVDDRGNVHVNTVHQALQVSDLVMVNPEIEYSIVIDDRQEDLKMAKLMHGMRGILQ